MIPSLAEVVRWRALVAALGRLVGVVMFFSAGFPLVWWLSEGLRDGDLYDLSYYGPRAALALAFVILGPTLGLLAPLRAASLVPLPIWMLAPSTSKAMVRRPRPPRVS